MQLQPRHEIWEFGTLPVSVLMPSLDNSSLMLAHSKLLMRSSVAEGGEREKKYSAIHVRIPRNIIPIPIFDPQSPLLPVIITGCRDCGCLIHRHRLSGRGVEGVRIDGHTDRGAPRGPGSPLPLQQPHIVCSPAAWRRILRCWGGGGAHAHVGARAPDRPGARLHA